MRAAGWARRGETQIEQKRRRRGETAQGLVDAVRCGFDARIWARIARPDRSDAYQFVGKAVEDEQDCRTREEHVRKAEACPHRAGQFFDEADDNAATCHPNPTFRRDRVSVHHGPWGFGMRVPGGAGTASRGVARFAGVRACSERARHALTRGGPSVARESDRLGGARGARFDLAARARRAPAWWAARARRAPSQPARWTRRGWNAASARRASRARCAAQREPGPRRARAARTPRTRAAGRAPLSPGEADHRRSPRTLPAMRNRQEGCHQVASHGARKSSGERSRLRSVRTSPRFRAACPPLSPKTCVTCRT